MDYPNRNIKKENQEHMPSKEKVQRELAKAESIAENDWIWIETKRGRVRRA
jgi:anaerobic selenocysteine-containing dehydrogenase